MDIINQVIGHVKDNKVLFMQEFLALAARIALTTVLDYEEDSVVSGGIMLHRPDQYNHAVTQGEF